MLQHTRGSEVEISSGFESMSFTIVDSKNSFALLQGKQYEKPVEATLRALVENGLDAHTQAASVEPIEIRRNKDGTIMVADKGAGISPDDFQKHFTKFFSSNRTSSNDYHGFFGVGAKAPLAIASQFFVTTVHQGTQYEWVCKRGNPAPTAELLKQEPAPKDATGTQVSIRRNDMDPGVQEGHAWKTATHKLVAQMPEKVHSFVQDGLHWDQENIQKNHHATLYVGGMPYPLPPADVLGLPSDMYETLQAQYTFEQTITFEEPARSVGLRGGAFGAKKKAKHALPTLSHRTRSVTDTLYKPLHVHCSIGDVELHFSKERVAFTPNNIAKIRELTLQTYTANQLEMLTALDNPTFTATSWRLSDTAAKELEKQGQSKTLLAWATRPESLSGAKVLLEAGEPLRVVIHTVQHKDTPSDTKKPDAWAARARTYADLTKVEEWAQKWGISMQWQRPTRSNMALASISYSVSSQELVKYNTTVAQFAKTVQDAKEPIIFAQMDAEWRTMAPEFRGKLYSWLSAHTQSIVLTDVPLEEVKALIPHAVGVKEYVAQKLQMQLDEYQDDALGVKKCVVYAEGRSHDHVNEHLRWADEGLPSYNRVSCHYPEEFIEQQKRMHAWTGVPEIEYVNLVDWVREQKAKVPLLDLLKSTLSREDIQHVSQLVPA